MFSKRIAILCLSSAVALTPATRAVADADGLVGGIVGGIVGGVIVNEANKNRQRSQQRQRATTRSVPRSTRSSGVSQAVRQERRQIQTSLNYFGFNAGTPDGVLGRRSRAAISQYQAYLGYTPTGTLTEVEKNILIGSYHRAVAGGTDVSRIISRDPDGVKAVLVAQRNNMFGGGGGSRRSIGYAGLPIEVSEAVDEIAESSDPSAEQLLQRSGFIQLADLNGDGSNDYILNTAVAGSSFWCNAVQCKTLVFASTADGYRRNDLLVHDPTPASFDCIGSSCRVAEQRQMAAQTQPQQDQGLPGLLPVFETETPDVSLSTYCSKVSVMTNANGGLTTVADMGDPQFTLSEQFCLARTYAIAMAEDLGRTVKGATPAQIETQCMAFGKAMAPYVASLSVKPQSAVVRDVAAFVLKTGMAPAQLSTTSKICLGTGYRKDNMAAAIGAGLLLVALGERPYAELIGHHLNSGLGAPERRDMAMGWYQVAFDALSAGATPIVAPEQSGRAALLQEAAARLGGTSGGAPAASTEAALPVFDISQ